VDAGVGLPTVYAVTAGVALALGLLSFVVARTPGAAAIDSEARPAS
jgi:hypothetical protein